MVKNCFLIITDPKNLNNGSRKWPLSSSEADFVLQKSASLSSLDDLFDFCDFPESVVKDVTDWTFSEFVCSALTYQFSNSKGSVYGWFVITQLLMNSYISDDVLLCLKNNSFYNKAIKNDLIKGVKFSFKLKNFWLGDEKCVRNVLIFLEIDKDDIESLLKDFSNEKSLEIISSYLLSLTKKPN